MHPKIQCFISSSLKRHLASEGLSSFQQRRDAKTGAEISVKEDTPGGIMGIYIYIYIHNHIYIFFCTAHWDFRRCWLGLEFSRKGRRSSSKIRPNKVAKNATIHRMATLQKVRVHLCLDAWCMVVEPLTEGRGQSSIHSRWILLKRSCSP